MFDFGAFQEKCICHHVENKYFPDFRGESICRLSWKVFADFGGNNTRLSFEGPNLVFQGEINCEDFRYCSINYISIIRDP